MRQVRMDRSDARLNLSRSRQCALVTDLRAVLPPLARRYKVPLEVIAEAPQTG
jgi:hypothetical protein